MASDRGGNGRARQGWRFAAVGLLVAGATFALYSRVLWPDFGFVSLDDPQYVRENRLVREPSWQNAATFFREVWRPSTVEGYYQPLTMVSLMLDAWICQTFQIEDAAVVFHLHNVLLHVVSTWLVFALLRTCGVGLAAAGWLALIFGVHPIQVESVAWIAQRKTVLASMLGLLAVSAYLRMGSTPGASRRVLVYTVSGLLYVLAVLAKPTVMLLPAAFVLLDYWPLRRLSWRGIAEKLPLFVLMCGAAYVAARSQAETSLFSAPESTQTADALALMLRNITSLWQRIIAPIQLAPVYPVSDLLSFNAMRTVIDAAIVASVLVIAWRARRRVPAAFVAIVSFLILVSPALGQVRFSEGLTGDRFAYFPLAFLLIPVGLLWSRGPFVNAPRVSPVSPPPDAVRRESHSRRPDIVGSTPARATQATTIMQLAGLGFTAVFCVASLAQMLIWRDGYTLFSYMLSLHPDSITDRVGLADWYTTNGRAADALPLLEEAVQQHPHVDEIRYFYGNALGALGRNEEALAQYQEAVRIVPGKQVYQQAFGGALLLTQQYERALQAFLAALAYGPDSPDLRLGVGRAYLGLREPNQARLHLQSALRDRPDDPELNFNMACACARMDDQGAAAAHLAVAVQHDPTIAKRAASEAALARWSALPEFRELISP